MIINDQPYAFFVMDSEALEYCETNLRDEYNFVAGLTPECANCIRVCVESLEYVFAKVFTNRQSNQNRPLLPIEYFYGMLALTDLKARQQYVNHLYSLWHAYNSVDKQSPPREEWWWEDES